MKFKYEIVIVGLVLLRNYYLYAKSLYLIIDYGLGVRQLTRVACKKHPIRM
jgi:hypothetical protein